jgi:hypothetical protein
MKAMLLDALNDGVRLGCGRQQRRRLSVAVSERHAAFDAQYLRRAAGWRAGCSAVGMTAKAVRSGHWFGESFMSGTPLKAAEVES